MSHMNAASPRQSLVKGERLTRYELAAVMVELGRPGSPGVFTLRVAEAGAETSMFISKIDLMIEQNCHCTDELSGAWLAAARTQATAVRNCAVDHREPGVLAGLTDARVQWPAPVSYTHLTLPTKRIV